MTLSNDALAIMQYENLKKSATLAYLLVFFVGMLGGHRFYLGRIATGIAQLLLTLTGVGMLISVVWAIIDLFLIPGMIQKYNDGVIRLLNS